MITGNKIFKKAVKIVSLTIGLTAGLVLLAKFWLDGRYDRWMTDSDRVYAIVSKYSEGEGEEPTLGSNVSGGVAPLLKTYSPDVEVALRKVSGAVLLACRCRRMGVGGSGLDIARAYSRFRGVADLQGGDRQSGGCPEERIVFMAGYLIRK